MKHTVTFGEIMLRLTPQDNNLLVQANSFDAHFGGSEFNVAAGLKALGLDSKFITKLPDNPVGKRALSAIMAACVETPDDILSPDGRLGIYYLEMGSSPRPNRVVYDRTGTSIIMAGEQGDFDWDANLENAAWFHVSGITPGLCDGLARETVKAIETAVSNNIPVSFDINYRAKLWTTDEAKKILEPLLKKCRLIITTEEDLERVFDMNADSNKDLAEKTLDYFGVEMVAITLRETQSVKRNKWGGCIVSSDGYIESRMYDIEIVDRVGAGDSFTAGLIAGLLMDKDLEYSINLAAAFSALKQTIPGDYCPASLAQTEELMKKGSAGRIQR